MRWNREQEKCTPINLTLSKEVCMKTSIWNSNFLCSDLRMLCFFVCVCLFTGRWFGGFDSLENALVKNELVQKEARTPK